MATLVSTVPLVSALGNFSVSSLMFLLLPTPMIRLIVLQIVKLRGKQANHRDERTEIKLAVL